MKRIIYQMLPRLWGSYGKGRSGKFSAIDAPVLGYLKDLGVTYVWYTGVLRHATKSASEGCTPSHPQFVKGEAGSPFSLTDFYDVNPYLAEDPANRMAEFEDLIRRTHEAGLKVIIDFIPNHVARDYGRAGSRAPKGIRTLGEEDDASVHWRAENDFFYYPGTALRLPNQEEFEAEAQALKAGRFDGPFRILPAWLVEYARKGGDLSKHEALLTPFEENPAKATGNNYTPRPGINDWYETVKINYCDYRTGTWDKMLEIVRYWAGKGVDGFRCDMVELVPAEFFTWLIRSIKAEFPSLLFVAEVYDKSLYGKYVHEAGFDLLYDKSGLYDALRAIVGKNVSDSDAPVELWQSARLITGTWQMLGDLQPRMLNFLENHDEQRIASEFFAGSPEKGFAALAVSLLMNTASFMLYFGQELGERGMDSEPFSGLNGRTTIFDWWQVDSLQKLWKDLHQEGGSSNPALTRYREILQLAVTEPAFSEGRSYDLCYCNTASPGFDRDRHYAFLRSDGVKAFLVAANFSGRDADMEIVIPEDAHRYCGMRLLSEKVHVPVKAMDYTIMQAG